MRLLPQSNDDIAKAVVNYMAQPMFAGEGLAEKVFGLDVEMEMLNLDEMKAYFSMSGSLDFEEAIKTIARNRDNVELAKLKSAGLVLGNYIYSAPNRYFFRLPAEDVRIDLNKKIVYQYGKVKCEISPAELYGFISNRNIYGGPLRVITGWRGNVEYFMHNRSPFIAKKGEPSMSRLVERIINGAETIEDKIQKLLDFVVLNINYAESDNLTSAEVLKRPNEVLMVRQGNCGNKTILFASLLEQIGAEYLILYLPRMEHASVAVSGKYPFANSLSFQYEGKIFSVADPTAESQFIIGETVPMKMRVEYIEYVQRPGDKFYSLKDKKFLPF